MSSERRRSGRVNLTIPLSIFGTDERKQTFKSDGRTITLSRYGALILVPRPLRLGQIVRVVNTLSNLDARFRVVGPVSPPAETGSEWAVDYVNERDDIWGIYFPPASSRESSGSQALLQCKTCHSVALLRVSLQEVDVLETSGILSRACAACGKDTPFGYPEKQIAMGAPRGEKEMLAEVQKSSKGADHRRHRRVCLQLPIMVRDYYGGCEITKTENVSKGGFCFSSEKPYLVGQGIMAVCPYDPSAKSIEVPARIVRRLDIEATHRRIYGVRYEPRGG